MESKKLFARAQRVIPGGVNSPVRAFHAVGGTPVHIDRARGCRFHAIDGRVYTDFCCSWGALLLGHAHPVVVDAVCRAAHKGTSFGAPTRQEAEFAQILCRQVPNLEQVRLVNSGTEATMTALRLARGATGRSRILKFEGCYHGHSDALLVAAGSGVLAGGRASSAGVSPTVARETFVAPYNDLAAVEALVGEHGDELAAIIVEPIAANMGLVLPAPGFLEGLRAAADRCGALLIFDEVITGFRLAPTTYGALCGVTPDLTCLGKIIGGGLPMGAVGGTRAIMDHLAPGGAVYQAGTLSGNPIAVAAGIATMEVLLRDDPYPALAALVEPLAEGLEAVAGARGVPLRCPRKGSLFAVFFTGQPVEDLASATACDREAFVRFFHAMLRQGLYLPPSPFETSFVSAAHGAADIDRYLAGAERALA